MADLYKGKFKLPHCILHRPLLGQIQYVRFIRVLFSIWVQAGLLRTHSVSIISMERAKAYLAFM